MRYVISSNKSNNNRKYLLINIKCGVKRMGKNKVISKHKEIFTKH